ncbi:uncharacterized protein J3D65DRAFT_670773 [Phyllosticta citribraziliensis]|uniref:RRM domain-containing protein n=1 Tax=Phyllosticta citribraziliensis TaxID=989973 RepID=A0ABR1LA70_9PEZI
MSHVERTNALNNSKAAKNPPAQSPPSATLYCNNLNDKLLKNDLKRELYMLFSNQSTVIDVVTLKTAKMRGQAHVVFQNAEKAGMAMKALQGYEFHGRKINIAYARGRSNVFNKLLGTYVLEQPAQQQPTGTALQQSIFNNPHALTTAPATNGDAHDADDAKRKHADEEASQQAKRQKLDAPPAEEEEEQEDDEMDMEESDED